jgi:hypothetical protein
MGSLEMRDVSKKLCGSHELLMCIGIAHFNVGICNRSMRRKTVRSTSIDIIIFPKKIENFEFLPPPSPPLRGGDVAQKGRSVKK